ncbi:MAG: hypothetical protein SGJ11_10690 [Phycisphaerae bacterium]|nr:hypothetical protein [Phycisphaerae bacterium]
MRRSSRHSLLFVSVFWLLAPTVASGVPSIAAPVVSATDTPTNTSVSVGASTETSQLLRRVAFIGASATAGFGVVAVDPDGKKPLVPMPLSAAFAGSITSPTETLDFGSPLFFLSPATSGTTQVDRSIAQAPTLVIAVDFLFWFGYGADDGRGGPLRSEADRLEKLDIGLEQLERFPASTPIVIGDFPDMSRAVGKMISASQMPKLETLEKLNAKLTAWAASRPNVIQFSLSALVEKLKSGATLTIAGMEFKQGGGRLIQSDQLHPTFRGAIALSLQVVDAIKQRFGAAMSIGVAPDESSARLRARERAEETLARRSKIGVASSPEKSQPVQPPAAR